jgi:threonine synthase
VKHFWSVLFARGTTSGLLPVNPVSLGQGGTPLVPFRGLLIKNETMNPAWSWKDRPASVSIPVAKHLGFAETVAISTGNHGNSVSACSAAAGLACTIFCNPEAPALQLALMARYGFRPVSCAHREASATPIRMLKKPENWCLSAGRAAS